MVKDIFLCIVGHKVPVHSPHIFTPPENLPDIAFCRCDRDGAACPCCFHRTHHFLRIDHFCVQGERQQGVKQALRLAAHRIFKIAKMR